MPSVDTSCTDPYSSPSAKGPVPRPMKRMGDGTVIRVLALIKPGTPASLGTARDPEASLRRSHKRSAWPARQAMRLQRRIIHAINDGVTRVTPHRSPAAIS